MLTKSKQSTNNNIHHVHLWTKNDDTSGLRRKELLDATVPSIQRDSRRKFRLTDSAMKGNVGYKDPEYFMCRGSKNGFIKDVLSKRPHDFHRFPHPVRWSFTWMRLYDFQHFPVVLRWDQRGWHGRVFTGLFVDFLIEEQKINAFPGLQRICDNLLKKLLELDGEKKVTKGIKMNKPKTEHKRK